MVGDHTEVRQATAVADRVNQFYRGSILGIQKAPTDGIEPDALRYQWPGTVTQTIEQAYLSWRDHPYERDEDGETKKDNNDVSIPSPGLGYLDAATGSSYIIDSLSFSPTAITSAHGPELLWPLVVTSCPALTTPEVISARRRVAAAARDIRGHYRLHGYTRGSIATNGAYEGPPSYEASVSDPACNGAAGEISVRSTQALVCSTLPWAAVQLANERAASAVPPMPRIVLDGRLDMPVLLGPEQEGCHASAFRKPNRGIDRVDANTPDGLYFYGKAEREKAARWLHDDYMVPKVQAEIDESMPDVWNDLGVVGGIGVSALIALLAAVPVTTVAVILGVAPAILAQLIILTSDMPDDVANQLCNAFASDDCSTSAKDSTAWTSPGEGESVSPDNIVNSWAAPTSANSEVIHGLYGWNDRIRMRPPELAHNPPPHVTWQISQGFGAIEGRAIHVDENGAKVGVPGARIRIGCAHFVAGTGGVIFQRDLPSGTYWCVAQFTDPATGLVLESKGQPVEIPDGGGIGLELELFGPPDTRREVLVTGHMDLVNRYAIGEDWWGHPGFAIGPTYLGLDYWPDTPEYAAQRKDSLQRTVGTSHQVDDWGHAELEVDLHIQPDLSVKATWRARLNEDDDEWQKTGEVLVPARKTPADPLAHVALDLVRSEMAWPVRAHIEFDIHNDIAP